MSVTKTPLPRVLCRVIRTLSNQITDSLLSGPVSLLHPLESVYLLGLVVVATACEIVFPLSPWQQKLPFLPLLVTSVYCSVGVTYSFLRLYVSLLRRDEKPKQL